MPQRLRLYRLQQSPSLWIMPRPRGGDWLEDELCELLELGADGVLSLLKLHEERELGLEREAEICRSLGLMFSRFSIPDRDLPESMLAFDVLIQGLRAERAEGLSLAIHCRQGIGRSSMAAVAFLAEPGVSLDDLWAQIAAARGRAVPDTEAQRLWIQGYLDWRAHALVRGNKKG